MVDHLPCLSEKDLQEMVLFLIPEEAILHTVLPGQKEETLISISLTDQATTLAAVPSEWTR